MPSPVEGSTFSKGELCLLTFITAISCANKTLSGKLYELTTGNNVSYNNSQITRTDNATGVIGVTANLNQSGNWLCQFTATGANNATIEISPLFEFKVEDPI